MGKTTKRCKHDEWWEKATKRRVQPYISPVVIIECDCWECKRADAVAKGNQELMDRVLKED